MYTICNGNANLKSIQTTTVLKAKRTPCACVFYYPVIFIILPTGREEYIVMDYGMIGKIEKAKFYAA